LADAERADARRGWLRRIAASLAGGGSLAVAASPRAQANSRAGGSGQTDVRDFGAVGDGVADDTSAIQSAIDAGTCVRIPAGIYRVSRLRLKSNLALVGDGAGSVLQGSAGMTLLQGLSASSNTFLENIELRGLRMQGAVTKAGFSEHVHLLSMAGVRNVLIDNVQFVGFQGDGLYLGAHSDNTRHNVDVRVVHSTFDGINKNNRNCISVIDGDGVFIQGCVFRRSSRRDMPGFIDVEPNDPTNVVRNIHVTGNHFEDTDGAVGAVSIVVLKPRLKVSPESFVISQNTFDIDIRMVAFRVTSDDGVRHNLVVTGNSGRVASLGDFYPMLRGATVGQNTLSVTGPAAFGYAASDSISDLSVVGNTFDGSGAARGVLDIRCGGGHVISGNVFTNCTHYAIQCGLAGGSLANISILGNVFTRCGTHAVMSSVGVDGATCRYLGNTSDTTHYFPAWINDDTGGISNGSSAPITFNASTPPAAFGRPGTYRAALDSDRAAPAGGARQGLLETRVERGRNTALWRLQRFDPAPDGAQAEAFYTRSSGRTGSWTAWVRHVGVRAE
jgi:hypothetical protein